jgi:hypothetical protein
VNVVFGGAKGENEIDCSVRARVRENAERESATAPASVWCVKETAPPHESPNALMAPSLPTRQGARQFDQVARLLQAKRTL